MLETTRDSESTGSSPDPAAIDRAVAAFQAGDDREGSFRFLFETYHRRVQGFFARRTRSTDDCLDLTQETFLRAYTGLASFRGDAPFGAWLYSIARNVHLARAARDARRKETTGLEAENPAATRPGPPRADDPDALAVPPEGLESVLDSEQRRLLRQAVARLPEQRRKCIVLWAYHGLTYEQIAIALRLALGTVKAHLAQARKQLEDLVETGVPSDRET
jgi:RNA polymerase sigma-70 factor (ECF subfamily)